jgi:hypothetical protein
VNPRLPRDLETVRLKCLEKEPGRRYESALAVADDLQCYLDGRPIQARPVGQAERLWRWCRLNPVVATLAAALVLIVAFSCTLVTAKVFEVIEERNKKEFALNQVHERNRQLESAQYLKQIQLA